MKPTFSHIINPVSENENASLFRLQQRTIESIQRAQQLTDEEISAEVITVVGKSFQGEAKFANKLIRLTRSVTDVHNFSEKRELPLISDILKAGADASNSDYLIFTNSDILLTPWFYKVAAHYLNSGHDALVINRRRIPARLSEQPFEVMLAHAGEEHIGFDCFVFKRSLLSKFVPTEICIGIPMAGNDIFYNIFTHADRPALLANQHLTFHLGTDLVKKWGPQEYYAHNWKEFRKLLKQLRPDMQIAKFPGAGLGFFRRHFRWLMNPTYHYPTMCSVDLAQLSARRPVYPPKEIPGLAHRYYEWLQRKVNFREKD